MIDWPSYNRSLVRRSEILFSYNFLDTWGYELDRMNEGYSGLNVACYTDLYFYKIVIVLYSIKNNY